MVLAVVIGGPCFSWFVALAVLRGRGGAPTYALLFLGLPFVLTLVAARRAGARLGALVALLSAAIGLLSWLYVAAVFASKFAD